VHFLGAGGVTGRADQVMSGSNAKYAPISPKMIPIVSTYARMAPSRRSDGAEHIR
jgi:hypothetical protein